MSDILIRQVGRVGHVTLNRPKALNALTYDMALALEQAMLGWADDPDVHLLMIDAEGDRAFCAGGDIVDIYEEGKQGRDERARQFWRDEYRINAAIAAYPKPYVAFMDGIVMGGGVGISAHGSHRIVTERTMFAMPECSIGLMPDVGGSLLLGRMPGHCGEYAGLTGARLSGADCLYGGLADFYVSSENLFALKEALTEAGDVKTIQDFIIQPPISNLQVNQVEIDALFSGSSTQDIHAALENSGTDFAQAALKNFNRNAPLGLHCALTTIRRARHQDSLALALRDEYRFVTFSISEGELIEGIRAAVIDKDRNPKWKYPTLESVPQEMVERLKHTAPDGDFLV